MSKATVTVLVAMLASLGLLAAACGDDDDGDAGAGDPCAEEKQIKQDAITEYCADKANVCCFCQCWQEYPSFGNYDAALYADSGTCECVEPQVGDPGACEGAAKTIAEECIADPTACGDAAVAVAEPLCDNTPLE